MHSARVQKCKYMVHAGACGSQRSLPNTFLDCSALYLLRQGLSLNLTLTDGLGCLVSEL